MRDIGRREKANGDLQKKCCDNTVTNKNVLNIYAHIIKIMSTSKLCSQRDKNDSVAS